MSSAVSNPTLQTRILPPEEWSRLAATNAADLWPSLDPRRAVVVVVEQDDTIIGQIVLLQILHAECLWIASSHRKRGTVARRILNMLVGYAHAVDAHTVWAAADTDEMRRILDRLGTKLPGDHYVLSIKGA